MLLLVILGVIAAGLGFLVPRWARVLGGIAVALGVLAFILWVITGDRIDL